MQQGLGLEKNEGRVDVFFEAVKSFLAVTAIGLPLG